eukprot:COSAG06_NODE_3586_length_5147_cov_6.618661_1_plen_837_part_00
MGQTTLFSHLYGLLLGGSEAGSALTAFAATGGHGPDRAEFWEHLFLLRVESATLSQKLTALSTPLTAEHQAVLRLIFSRAAEALQDGHAHRMANACLTLEIMFDHVLAVRKLQYVSAVAVICGADEADQFFSALFSRLHTILTAPAGGGAAEVALPSAALQALLAVVTAEANISESIIFARLLQARFDGGASTAKKLAEEEAAYAAAAAEYGGTTAATAASSDTVAQRTTTDFFHAALAAIQTGQAAAAELTPSELAGSRRGYTTLSLQSDALMLVALAAHYQRGECDNPFLSGVEKLGPRNARELQVLARAVHGGMRRWLASTVCALAEHEEAQAGWGTFLAGAVSRMLGYEDDGADVVSRKTTGTAGVSEPAAEHDGGGGGGGGGGTLWHGALASILLLYELLYRNRTFTRATYELDRAQRRARVAEKSTGDGDSGGGSDDGSTADAAAAAGDIGSSAAATYMSADSGLGPGARTTLVGGLLPIFCGVCGAVFVEAGRVGAAGVGLAGGSGGGASVGGAAECCLATLLAMLEDEYICEELLLPAAPAAAGGAAADDGEGSGVAAAGHGTARYCFFSRLPAPLMGVKLRSEVTTPGCALFTVLVGFMKANLRPTAAATPVALYAKCFNVLHRLFSLAQAAQGGAGTGLGSVESWGTLWESLTSLLRLFAVEPLEGASQSEQVCTKALHVFNYVITYGDVFLPSAELYDKLYYEILRARDVFDKLHQHLAWSGGSRSLERALRNVRSIATQLGEAVSLENAKIAPETLGTDAIMSLIAGGKSTLQLQLLEELEQRDVYVEALQPSAGLRRLINTLAAERRAARMAISLWSESERTD